MVRRSSAPVPLRSVARNPPSNSPEPYTDSFEKTWCLDAPSGEATVTFTDFETESGYDFVSVGDKTGRIVSKTSGTTVTSSRVYVIFKTDASVAKKGWRATWSSP